SGSSVSLSGNVLTLNLSITFQTAFNGNKNIYLQANNAFGSSGWQLRGSWTVAAAPSAAAVSVTPNAGTGAVQTLQFLYSDSAGAPDLRQEWVWFTPAFGGSAANSCMLYYEQAGNLLRLINDAGTAWLAGTPG